MPAVGSSSSSSRGFCTRLMASSSRRLSPRDRLPAVVCLLAAGRRPRASARPRRGPRPRAATRLPGVEPERAVAAWRSAGTITFSSRLRSGKISGVWKTRATPSWLISYGRLPVSDLAVEDDGAGVRRDAADADVEQRRLAGAVRADDRVRLAFLDCEVDVAERVQAAEALADVGDVQHDVLHRATPPAGRGGARSRRPRRVDQAPDPPRALHQPAGQEDDDQHEEHAERQLPALADEQRGDRDEHVLQRVGQEGEDRVQRRLVEGREDVLEVLDRSPRRSAARAACRRRRGSSSAPPRPRPSTASARRRPADR